MATKFQNFLGNIAPIGGLVANIFAPGSGSAVSGILSGIANAGGGTSSPPRPVASPPPAAPPPHPGYAVNPALVGTSHLKWGSQSVRNALTSGDAKLAQQIFDQEQQQQQSQYKALGGSSSTSSSADKWNLGSAGGGGSNNTQSGASLAAMAAGVVFVVNMMGKTVRKITRPSASYSRSRSRSRRRR